MRDNCWWGREKAVRWSFNKRKTSVHWPFYVLKYCNNYWMDCHDICMSTYMLFPYLSNSGDPIAFHPGLWLNTCKTDNAVFFVLWVLCRMFTFSVDGFYSRDSVKTLQMQPEIIMQVCFWDQSDGWVQRLVWSKWRRQKQGRGSRAGAIGRST